MTTTTIENEQHHRLQELSRDMSHAGRQVFLASRELEQRKRPGFEKRVLEGREKLRESGEQVVSFGRQAEHRLEQRVSDALRRFGVPARDDVQALIDRIEVLTQKVEKLSARS